MIVRMYTEQDLASMIAIWNEVVEDGIAFPQETCLDIESGAAFVRTLGLYTVGYHSRRLSYERRTL